MSPHNTTNELLSQTHHLSPANFSMDGTAETTETMVDSTMNISECSAYVSSPAEATCVAVIIGCNAPTRKSILISPSGTSPSTPLSHTNPPSRASSTTSPIVPIPADGIETGTPAITRASSLDSSNANSSFEQSPSAFQHEEQLSQEQKLNVKFAPLPDVGPRKRRGMPLGVASRSRMVRRRRAQAEEPGTQPRVAATPMWTNEEMEMQRQRLAKAWEKEREKRDYYPELDETEDQGDPIAAFGRLVKVAGKQLWNKIGGREGKDERGNAKARENEKNESEALAGKKRDSGERSARYSISSVSSTQTDRTSSSIEERAPVPGGIDEEKDESWEEIRRKDIATAQSDHGTTAHKRSLWRRTRTASKIVDDLSLMSITKSSFSGGNSEVQPENKERSKGLRRSLSV